MDGGNDISIGRLQLDSSQLMAELKKAQQEVTKLADHLNKTNGGQLAVGLTDSMKTVSSTVQDVQQRLLELERASKQVNLDNIERTLSDLNATVVKISQQLENTLGGALEALNKDGNKVDFSGIIHQQRSLSNAFQLSMKDAEEQKKAIKEAGKYEGDSFGLAGLNTQVNALTRALGGSHGLLTMIDELPSHLEKLREVDFGTPSEDLELMVEHLRESYEIIINIVNSLNSENSKISPESISNVHNLGQEIKALADIFANAKNWDPKKKFLNPMYEMLRTLQGTNVSVVQDYMGKVDAIRHNMYKAAKENDGKAVSSSIRALGDLQREVTEILNGKTLSENLNEETGVVGMLETMGMKVESLSARLANAMAEMNDNPFVSALTLSLKNAQGIVEQVDSKGEKHLVSLAENFDNVRKAIEEVNQTFKQFANSADFSKIAANIKSIATHFYNLADKLGVKHGGTSLDLQTDIQGQTQEEVDKLAEKREKRAQSQKDIAKRSGKSDAAASAKEEADAIEKESARVVAAEGKKVEAIQAAEANKEKSCADKAKKETRRHLV